MHVAGVVIEAVLFVFVTFMFVRLVTSVVQSFARSWSPRGLLLVLLEAVYSFTDPPIRALRRVIPPLRLGGMAFDIAFTLVFVAALVLQSVNRAVLL